MTMLMMQLIAGVLELLVFVIKYIDFNKYNLSVIKI
jgi:hypothetical protein